MKSIILAAALAVFSACAHAAERFNPGDVKTGEPRTTPGGKYVNYLVDDGVCLQAEGIGLRAASLDLVPAGVMQTPAGNVLVLVSAAEDYAEGWLIVDGEQACLYILTYKAGGGSA